MTQACTVHYLCHSCNKTHGISLDFRPKYGPDKRRKLADILGASFWPEEEEAES